MTTKKTTLMLDEDLYAQIRERASKRGVSVSLVVAEALRVYMAEGKRAGRAPVKLTKAKGGGWIAPVDASSTAQILDYLDEDLPLEKQR